MAGISAVTAWRWRRIGWLLRLPLNSNAALRPENLREHPRSRNAFNPDCLNPKKSARPTLICGRVGQAVNDYEKS
jgi:hypothetical protein